MKILKKIFQNKLIIKRKNKPLSKYYFSDKWQLINFIDDSNKDIKIIIPFSIEINKYNFQEKLIGKLQIDKKILLIGNISKINYIYRILNEEGYNIWIKNI